MRLLTGKRATSIRRCRNKPKKKNEGDSEEQLGRMDDGASHAYRKMGRNEYEKYVKHMAKVWWNVPLSVENSGLFMEMSKQRLRGVKKASNLEPVDNHLFTEGYPQPHYTLKILRTAYKIYRLRMEKRYNRKNDKSKTLWFWSDQKRDEEPKWATILDRPLFEQYVLMLQYIRNLAGRLAWKLGHKEVFSSETPLRVMEKLHPLKHLDFREAKHYLPKPFITSSDSIIQLKIDNELKRLNRAVAKVAENKEIYTPLEMLPADDEVGSSSSSSSSSSSEDDFEKGRRKTFLKILENPPEHMKNQGYRGTLLMGQHGEIYKSYKDPGSDESIFVDFLDLDSYVTRETFSSNASEDIFFGEPVSRQRKETTAEENETDMKNKENSKKISFSFSKKIIYDDMMESKRNLQNITDQTKQNSVVPGGSSAILPGTSYDYQESSDSSNNKTLESNNAVDFTERLYDDQNDRSRPGPSHEEVEDLLEDNAEWDDKLYLKEESDDEAETDKQKNIDGNIMEPKGSLQNNTDPSGQNFTVSDGSGANLPGTSYDNTESSDSSNKSKSNKHVHFTKERYTDQNDKNRPGPSHEDVETDKNLLEDNPEVDDNLQIIRRSTTINVNPPYGIQETSLTDGEMCIVVAGCHGDFVRNKLKTMKERNEFNMFDIDSQEHNQPLLERIEADIDLPDRAAGGDAAAECVVTSNTRDQLNQVMKELDKFKENIDRFSETTEKLLNNIEKSMEKLEMELLLKNRDCSNNCVEMKRHLKIILRRIHQISV